MAVLEKLISDVRIEIGDKGKTVWANDEIIRAIEKSVSLMSRLLPKRDVVETTIVRTITGATLTIANSTGTLAYKPIKVNSVNITGKTLDTHYRINYLTGVVTEIGSGLPDADYTVSYELDSSIVDLSTILTDYIKIERVECPAGGSPPNLLTFDTFGNLLVLRAGVSLVDNDHLRIVYLCKWTPPTPTDSGSFPSHLDDIVIIGSAGQALIYKAEEYTGLAKISIVSASTVMDGIAAITFPSTPDFTAKVTLAETALDAAITQAQAAVTTLASMATPLGSASTAYSKMTAGVGVGEDYLTTGAPLINTGTRGEDVGAIYGQYAGYEAGLLQRYIDEGSGNIALALAWEAKAARQNTIANSYINEAVQRLAVVARVLEGFSTEASVANSKVNYYTAQLNKAAQLTSLSGQYLNVAGRLLASGQSKVVEFLTSLGFKPESSSQKASSEQRS